MVFLEDPGNLPRPAVEFAKAVKQASNGWVVQTRSGVLRERFNTTCIDLAVRTPACVEDAEDATQEVLHVH